MVEDRVLAMMENTRALPPPPSRSQTMPNPNPPSPAGSQKESWWATAKNKLTPTKEKELTPAQQVIQDVKTRDARGPIGKPGGEMGERGKRCLEPVVRSYFKVCIEEGGLGLFGSAEEAEACMEEGLKDWDERPGCYWEFRAAWGVKPSAQ